MTDKTNRPRYSLSLKELDSNEPLEVSEVKKYLKIKAENNDEDEIIKDLIKVSRVYAEQKINFSIVKKAVKLTYYDYAPKCISLPYAQVQSIDNITVEHVLGEEQKIGPEKYFLSNDGEYIFFTETIIANFININYTIGFFGKDSIKEAILSSMKSHIFFMYNKRDWIQQEEKAIDVLYDKIYLQNRKLKI